MTPVALVMISCTQLLVMSPFGEPAPAMMCRPHTVTIHTTIEECAAARASVNRNPHIPGYGYCVSLELPKIKDEPS